MQTFSQNERAVRTINLGDYRSPHIIVLSGRSRAEKIRDDLRLDEEDKTTMLVHVVVPDDILSLNSSFFLGLFDHSIEHLGISAFEEKYQFNCTAEIRQDVEKGMQEAINKSNALLPRA